jgi:hypothetical protein
MKKLAIANGKYIKDGVEKTRWVTIGTINTTADGKEYMLLDPTINLAGFPREIGKDMLMVGMFEQQPQQQGKNNQTTSAHTKQAAYNPNNYDNY